MQKIILGDSLNVMKTFSDNSFTSIVTDPPYGLKFMGKTWDYGIPGKEYWAEALRLTKPGGHLLAFGGSRTYHRLTCLIEDAGWEIRDCIMWLYGSGFPKSHNNFGIDGYGTALKPAYEPIIVAMKKCEGTFAKNVEKWGLGGLNIDESRIAIQEGTKRSVQANYPKNEDSIEDRSKHWARTGHNIETVPVGRWPANVILDEESGKVLDDQTGILTSGSVKPCVRNGKNPYSGGFGDPNKYYASSSGGASRFFYCAKASASERNAGCEGLEDKNGGEFNSTVAGDTRNGNITIQKNNHPTVKPIKLMEYLLKLISPPRDINILDPFCGSGSTLVAAKKLNFSAIGIEKEKDYYEIAKKRIENT